MNSAASASLEPHRRWTALREPAAPTRRQKMFNVQSLQERRSDTYLRPSFKFD